MALDTSPHLAVPLSDRALGRRRLIDVAMGRTPADTLVVGGRLVNVATAEIYAADVAIAGERIAAVGDVGYTRGAETHVIDAGGRFVTPGLVDGHLHMYHSYLGVPEFTEAMLRHGVTTTADAFYGQGIVGGLEAIKWFKDAFNRMPLRVLFLVPVLAYLQNRELGLTPTPGVDVPTMFEMLDWPDCYGLEEPPFLPIVNAWPEFLELFEAALDRRKVITGHASGIDFRQTQAYVAMGCATDHETVDVEDALRKVRAGMKLLIRQGSGCTDVPQVVRALTEHGVDPRSLAFSVDVASPEKLVTEGGIDENIRVAIAHGVPPVTAVQMGTLNVAEGFFAQQDVGLIAPGRYADVLLVDDLPSFAIQRVIAGGRVVVEDDRLVETLPGVEYPASFYGTVRLPKPLDAGDFAIPCPGEASGADVRVIGISEGSLVSEERQHRVAARHGVLTPSLDDDVLLLAMVDRHGKGTGAGVGFVQGFGLKRGAIASTVNAVCENIVIVGTDAADMAVAANTLAEAGGGKVVVADGEVLSLVNLPVLGLIAEAPLDEVMAAFDGAFAAIRSLGCALRSPFSQLEFCFACGEIGDIKLSEEGLVRVHPPERLSVVLG
jgi:adenine deaminase